MKRIYLLAYITILCCLCPLLKAQLGPMPFTPVPPNDPSLVRLLNSDVRCRQWVDSVMQRLTLKERIGQLFIYTIAPQQDKANKELLILDEPLHGLDTYNRRRVKKIIEAFCHRRDKTMIMVTHYENELPQTITNRLFLKRNR